MSHPHLRHLAWKLTLPLGSGLGLLLLVLGLAQVAGAANSPRRLAVGETCFATPNNGATVYSSTNATAVQSAADVASANGTVKIAGMCVGVQARAGSTQTVYISQTLTLAGGYTLTDWTTANATLYPTTLDAQSSGRVVLATQSLTLTNLMLQNGRTTTGDGGSVSVTGALVVSNTQVLSSTSASGQGGGVYASGALTLSNAQFYTNTSSTNGGGAYSGGALSITGGWFQNNQCTGNCSGGAASTNSLLIITDTQFYSNTAFHNAGAVHGNGNVYVTGAYFAGNRATSFQGGALATFGGTGTFIVISDTQFYSNTAPGNGGAIRASGPLSVSNSVFDRNTATNGGGVAFTAGGALTNTLFARNSASAGAAVYANGGTVHIRHATIASPTLASVAAVYVNTGTVYITNTLVASHTTGLQRASGTLAENYNLFSTVTTAYAGGVTSGGNSLTGTAAFEDTADYKLTSASAALNAGTNVGVTSDYFGEPRPQNGGYDIGYDELLNRCLVHNGTTLYDSADASAVRSAISATSAGGTIKLAGYCAGVATQSGSTQVALITKTLTLRGGYTSTNWTTSDPAANPTTLDAQGGGRVLSITVAASLEGFTVTNGYVTNLSGAGINATTDLTLTSMGVYSNVLTGTSTTAVGGGLAVAGRAWITGSAFISNYSDLEEGGGGAGFSGQTYITNTTFASNTAAAFGGGAAFDAAGSLFNTTFRGNTAYFGGGVFFDFNDAAFITASTFSQNTATDVGGGAYFYGATSITDTVFDANTSANTGGGAWFGNPAYVTDTTFVANVASASGGAVTTGGNSNPKQFVNTLFSGNSATSGVIAAYNGSPFQLIHVTLVSATVANGPAVYLGNSTAYITNTLIASHTVGLQRANGTLNEHYNLFSNVPTPYTGTVVSGGNSLTGTAAFYDTTHYTLTANSYAVDTGTNAGVTSDYAGEVRPQGFGYDIGYDESPYSYVCFATPDNGTTVYSSTNASALRSALAAAPGGATVKFAGTCAGVVAQGGFTQTALITQTLTLKGGYTVTNWTTQDLVNNPTVLDAQGGGRGLYISVTASLDGFTLTNGYLASGNGAGLYAANALTLTNVNVYSNTTAGDGGGAYIVGAATITGGTFQQNSGGSLRHGGGAYLGASGAISGTQFLTNTFTSHGSGIACGTTESCGGGLYAVGPLTAQNVTWQGNSARTGAGMVIFNQPFTGTANIFSYNTGTGQGGGGYFGDVTIITASTFSNNTSGAGGGAYFNGTIGVTNSVFLNNTTTGSGGGFVHENNKTGRFVNLLLAGNTAGGNGNAINLGSDALTTLANLTIVSPTTVVSSAAVYISNNSTVLITNTLIASHTTGLRRVNGTVRENYNLFSNVTTPYSGTFVSGGNSITNGAAGFYNTTYYTLTTASSAIDMGTNTGVTSDYFGNPRPQGDAYDIGYAESPYSHVCFATPDDGTTVYSSADASALRSALAVADPFATVKVAGTCAGVSGGQVATITQSLLTLRGGYSTTDWFTSDPSAYPTILDAQNSGRVLYITGSDATLENLTVQNGYSSSDGAGLKADRVSLSNVNVYSNTAGTVGGGVAANTLTLSGGVFQNNLSQDFGSSFEGGAGVHVLGTLTLSETQFVSNTARGSGGGGYVYGAAFLNGGVFQLNQCTDSSCLGGGLYVVNEVTLTDTQFLSNTAQALGGGLYAEREAYLSGGTFQQNLAGDSGGGAYFSYPASLTATTFTSNTATGALRQALSAAPAGGSGLSGGGAYFYGATLNDVTFMGNQADYQGGGAYIYTDAYISGTAFLTNTAANGGGGAYFGGPSFYGVAVTNTTFIGNRSTGSSGGGLNAWNTSSGLFTGIGLYFYNNQAAGGSGGGGYWISPAAVSDSAVISNSATSRGGGLFFYQQAYLTNTTVTSNTANGAGGGAHFNSIAALNGLTFSANTSLTQGGGADLANSGSYTITASTFTNNTAPNGGGAYIWGETVNVTNTTFTGNTASSGNGGGLYLLSNFSELVNLANNTFTGNRASNQGGGLYVDDGAITLTASVFRGNTAVQGGGAYLSGTESKLLTNVLFAGNSATSNGAALYNTLGNATLYHTTIASPTVGSGSAVYVGLAGSAYLSNTLIASYTVGLENAGGSLTQNYNLFSNVTTPTSGTVTGGGNSLTGTAAFYNTTGYTLSASSHAIDAGTNAGVTTDYFGDPRPQGGGYDIGYDESPYTPTYVCFATPNNGTTVFSSTTASAVRSALAAASAGSTVKVAGYCSGVATENGSTQVALITQTLTLRGGYTTTNWTTSNPTANPTTLDAQSAGRVLSVTVSANLQGFTVTNGYISSTVTQHGGGIFAAAAVNLADMVVANNIITGVAGTHQGGGAYKVGSATNTTFINNAASSSGGGVYFDGIATAAGVTFSGNTTNGSGGGAYFPDKATLITTTFSSNTAGAGGGARFDGEATVISSTFSGNTTSGGSGGAQFVSTANVMATTFSDNQARSGSGGGASFNSSSAQLTNVLFARNTATTGAAIYSSNASPLRLLHVTVVSPTVVLKAAILVQTGTVYITNTLIASHTVGIERNNGTVVENYNLFDTVTTATSGTVTSGGNSLTGTAAFYNTTWFTLTAASSAVDAGTNAGVTSDYFGDPRPQGGGYDIGYDESPFTPAYTCFATPDNGTTVFSSTTASAVRSALAAAATNATVKVAGYCAGVATQNGSTQVALITQTLTLKGGYTTTNWTTSNPAANPTILDALNSGRVLSVTVNATLQGFTATQGYVNQTSASGYGGGIYAAQALTLTDMGVLSNTTAGTSSRGGGAYVAGAMTLSNTKFISNVASASGGGFFVANTALLTSVTFISNTGQNGGGAYIQNVATATALTFTDNRATNNGGGAYFQGAATVTGTTFASNRAGNIGGGVEFQGTATLTATTFTTNTANSGGGASFDGAATLTAVTFTSNTANNSSGGGATFYGTATLTATTFTSNTAANSTGGGAFFVSSTTLAGTTFTGNTATQGGGAYSLGALTLAGVTFSNNQASLLGGGAYFGSTAEISGTTFQSNTVTTTGGGGAYFEGAAALTQTTFLGNTSGATGGGGGAYFASTASLSSISFLTNTSGANAGGGYFNNAAFITNTLFTNNSANAGGGAYFGSTAEISGTIFTGNTASGNGGGARFGGAATLTGATFTNNRAVTANGGGAAFFNTASVTRSVFISNFASASGGGVYVSGAFGQQLVNVLLAQNFATNGAAVGVANAAPLQLVHVTIVSPTVVSQPAFYMANGTVYLTNTVVASHTTGLQNVSGTLTENYNLFSNVNAPYNGSVTSGGNSLTGTAAFYNTTWYTLTAASRAVDAGVNASINSDYFGDLRPQGNGYDIGYDESPFTYTPGYVITPTAGTGGTITPSTPQTVSVGGSLAFTITPNTGYHIVDVGVDGTSLGAITNYTFTNVSANHTLSAAFAINTYVITPTVGPGGSLTPGTVQTVTHGSSLTFTITPNMGYTITNVFVDTNPQGPLTTYVFTNITSSHTIQAIFNALNYTLTLGTAGNGSGVVTPTTGVYTYAYGTVVTLTATANFGSTFTGWSGACSGTGNCVVTMTGNLTATATFATNKLYLPFIRK